MKAILTSILIFLTLGLSQIKAENSVVFEPINTIDGHSVTYGDLNQLDIEFGQSGPAVAIYNELGAYILYDPNVIDNLSPLGKYLILEHERAHHRLGHTLFTKISRELNQRISSFTKSKNEKDADCEAGYSLKDDIAYFGKVSREDITVAMNQIYHALGGAPDSNAPSWLLSRIDVIDVCYKGELLPRPTPLEEVKDILNLKIEILKQRPLKRHHGPNCWNSALYTSELAHQVRFTSSEEFHHLMESPYCETLNSPEPKSIKIYRVDLAQVLDAQREFHASLWLDEEISFNKMTVFSTSAYKEEENSLIDSKYKYLSGTRRFSTTDSSGVRQSVGCGNETCENEIIYKKCQNLHSIEKDIRNIDYKIIYREILKLERDVSSYLFEVQSIKENVKVKMLEHLKLLEKELVTLTSNNESEKWQLEYFNYILKSLKSQLTMRQPNWLK